MLKILVVDDNESIRELLQIALAGPYEVFTAPTEEEAKSYLQRKDIDLMFLDVWLGGHNSMSIIPWMVENNVGAHTILITGDDRITVKPEYKSVEEHIDYVLVKPFGIQHVIRIAASALKKNLESLETQFRSTDELG